MSIRDDDGRPGLVNGASVVILMLPVILVCALGGVAAWAAARRGAPVGIVRLLCFPAVFATSNFAGLLMLVAVCFSYGLFADTRAMLYERLTDYLDLTLFAIWGPLVGWAWNFDAPLGAYAARIPLWHIALFQAGVWLALGRWMGRVWLAVTLSLAGRS